jgi:sec-independent protein translocase protein TatC
MALLERVLQREPRSKREVEDSRMSVIEHLEALRRALIVIIAAWGLTTVVGFIFWVPIFSFLIKRGGLKEVFFPAPTGAFLLGLKVAVFAGFALAIPIIAQQVWWFVSPGLHRHERRFILPLIAATIFFFYVGMGFALFSLPVFIKILTGFAPQSVKFLPFADDYLGFLLGIMIAFGLVFEMPVVLFLLGMMGVISSAWLYKNRLYWIVALLILAQFLTPGADPFTPLIMFIPLYVLWEASALLLKLTGH